MNIRTISLSACLIISSTTLLQAGARHGDFVVVNVSKQPMNKEGKRLFELIQKDLKELYNDPKFGFTWETGETTIRTIDPALVKGCFKPMIILKDKKKLEAVMEKVTPLDGIIAFEYDLAGKKVRLKHFNWAQKESILIRLPINQGGAMNLSLWKQHRRGALVALGHSFEFNP